MYVFGTKDAVDSIGTPIMYRLAQGAQPVALAEKQPENQHAHIAAFYECVRKGGPNPADIKIGSAVGVDGYPGR